MCQNPNDFVAAHHEVGFAAQPDFVAGVLSKQDAVAYLQGGWTHASVVQMHTLGDCNHFTMLRCRLDAFDYDAILNPLPLVSNDTNDHSRCSAKSKGSECLP